MSVFGFRRCVWCRWDVGGIAVCVVTLDYLCSLQGIEDAVSA